MQREASEAQTPVDVVRSFVRAVRSATPATRLVYAMPWPPPTRREARPPGPEVADGALGYRVLMDLDLTTDACLDDAAIEPAFLPRDHADADGDDGALARITAADDATTIDGHAIDAADPVFGAQARSIGQLAGLPVFWLGRVQAWIVAASAPGEAFGDEGLALLLTAGNMLARVAVHLDTLNTVERLNARLRGTMDEIGRVQRSLLPGAWPPDPRLSFASSYEPSEAAGGDYYDYRAFPNPTGTEDDLLGVVIADVSGHGPVASVVMAIMRTALHAFRLYDRPPDTTVPEINRLLYESLDTRTFVTAFFLTIDPATGRGVYASCGHNPPRLRRAGGAIVPLDEAGVPPLGLLPELETHGAVVVLEPGDLVVLYTDGITEAFGPGGELFGVGRLDAAVRAGAGDPSRTKREILGAVAEHQAGRRRVDDQTLVIVRYNGPDAAAGSP